VIPDEVSARRRHQRGESLDQLERLEDERRRAVAPAALEPVEQAAVRELGEPLAGEGRSGDVTASCGPGSYADPRGPFVVVFMA